MGLNPVTLEKVWYSRGNIPFPDYSTTARVIKSAMWLIKGLLCNEVTTGTIGTLTRPTSSTWACEQSCDGITLGTGDRWGSSFDESKIVFGGEGTTHSWVVLRNPAGDFWITMASDGANIRMKGCGKQPTGGTLPYTPLHADMMVENSFAPVNTASEHLAQFCCRSDGQFHIAYSNTAASPGKFHTYLHCQTAEDGDNSSFNYWMGATSAAGSDSRGAPQRAHMSTEFIGFNSRTHNDSGASLNGKGCIDYTWAGVADPTARTLDGPDYSAQAMPILLNEWRTDASYNRNCWRGRLADMYYLSGAVVVGSSVPNATAPQFHVVGHYLIPFEVIPTLYGGAKGASYVRIPAFGPIPTETVVSTVTVDVPRGANSVKSHIVRTPSTDRYLLEVPTSALDLTDYGVGSAIGTLTTNTTSANTTDTVLALETSSELSNFELNTGVLIPSVAGLYSIAIDVKWNFDAGASIKRILTAWINGADAGSLTFYGTVTSLHTDQFTTLLRLAAGDTVTIRCSQAGGGNTSYVDEANIKLAYVAP